MNRPDCATETLDASNERDPAPAWRCPWCQQVVSGAAPGLDPLKLARQQGRDEMLLAALQAIGQAPSGPTKDAVTAEIHNGHRALEKL